MVCGQHLNAILGSGGKKKGVGFGPDAAAEEKAPAIQGGDALILGAGGLSLSSLWAVGALLLAYIRQHGSRALAAESDAALTRRRFAVATLLPGASTSASPQTASRTRPPKSPASSTRASRSGYHGLGQHSGGASATVSCRSCSSGKGGRRDEGLDRETRNLRRNTALGVIGAAALRCMS